MTMPGNFLPGICTIPLFGMWDRISGVSQGMFSYAELFNYILVFASYVRTQQRG
jgi:hypothetical protein